MSAKARAKGPWTHRFAVVFFSILLAAFFFWLLSFVVDDIGSLKGPDYEATEKRLLDQGLVSQAAMLDVKIAETNRRIADLESSQSLLRDSTTSSQRTMNQLLEMQKLSIQKNVTPTPAEQNALAESESTFLANQKRYQSLNEDIARLSDGKRALEASKREIDARLAEGRKGVDVEFARLARRHNFKVAALQLAFLMPIVLVCAYFFLRKRSGIYAPLIYAAASATIAQVILVMHEHFPSRYFKYIFIAAVIAVIVRILVSLIRAMAFPKADLLIKQYREAYERFLCPVCEYPIRRGSLKYRFWDRRSIRKLAQIEQPAAAKDEPYTCPACGTALYEECASCHGMRHSLLPYCETCGARKDTSA